MTILSRSFAWISLVLVLVAAQAALSLRLRALSESLSAFPVEDARRLSPRLVEVLSFGHLPLAVDFLWMRALQDPGQGPRIFFDLDAATELDPAFYEVYVYGANLLAVLRADAVGAQRLLEKGDRFRKEALPAYPDEFKRRYWAQAWNVPMLLAYVHLFELGDLPHAAIYFRETSGLPGAPAYLFRLAERLEKPGGHYEVGLKLLDFLISGEREPRAIESLEKKRRSLRVSEFVFRENRSFRLFAVSDPRYRSGLPGDEKGRDALWRDYLRKSGSSGRDPWGGVLSLGADGKVATSTPHDRVFGLNGME